MTAIETEETTTLARLNEAIERISTLDEAQRLFDEAETWPHARRVDVLLYAGEWLEGRGECALAAARFVAAAEAGELPFDVLTALLGAARSYLHAGRAADGLALLSRPWGFRLEREHRVRIRAARVNLLLALDRPADAAAEVEKAKRLAGDSEDAHLRAELWEAAARVAAAHEDQVAEELEAWYACSAALREILDGEFVEDDLIRFVRARRALAIVHANRGDCILAGTVIEEAVNRLWVYLRPDRDAEEWNAERDSLSQEDLAIDDEAVYPTFVELLADCAVIRATELEHVGRGREALAFLDTLDEALDSFRDGAEVLADRARINSTLGRLVRRSCCSEAAARYGRAAAAYRVLAERDPDVLPLRQAADLDHASEHVHLGEHANAVAIFDRVVPEALRDWTSAASRLRLAEALDQYGRALEDVDPPRCEEAAAALRRAGETRLELAGGDGERRVEAGQSFRLAAESLAHLSRNDEAHALLDRALELLPESGVARVEALGARGKTYEFAGRFDEALAAYGEAAGVAAGLEGDARAHYANALTAHSRMHDRAGEGEVALAVAGRAVSVWESYDPVRREQVWVGVAASHEAVAEALVTCGLSADAIEPLDRAVACWRTRADQSGESADLGELARLLGRRAFLLAQVGDEERALAAQQEQIAILRTVAESGDPEALINVAHAQFERARTLWELGEHDAFEAAIAATVDAATKAPLQSPALFARLATFQLDRGRIEDAKDAAEALVEIVDEILAHEPAYPRCILLDFVADHVRPFADAGRSDVAATLIAAALRHAAPDGHGDPESFARFLEASRQLTTAQLRNVYDALPDEGAALRMLMGRRG